MATTLNRRATDLEQDYQAQIFKDIANTRRMFYFSYAIIWIAIISLCVFGYWRNAPYLIFELQQYKADVHPDPILGNGNEQLTVSFDYCKYDDLPAKVKRTLIGSRVSISLPVDHQEPLAVGCGRAERNLLIPKINNTGTYHIHYEVTYKVNPIRNVTVEYDTQDFEITKEGDFQSFP